jgi:hypothetical protein
LTAADAERLEKEIGYQPG